MADYTCPQCGGESDAAYAESNWREVDGEKACSAYCAAKQRGADEDEAQQARAEHTEKVAGSLKEQRIAEARALLQAEGVEFFDEEDEENSKKTARMVLNAESKSKGEL